MTPAVFEHKFKIGGAIIAPSTHAVPRLASVAPANVDAPALAHDYAKGIALDMFGNDVVGDCVWATLYYRWQLLSKIHGTTFAGTTAECLKDYQTNTGWNGVVGDSSDKGTNPEVALAAALKGLSCGMKINAWVQVDFHDFKLLRAAIHDLSGVYMAIALPQNIYTNADGRWDVPANPTPDQLGVSDVRGHMCLLSGYDHLGVYSAKGVAMTNEWIASCGKSAYVLLDDALTVNGISPSGFDLKRLQADFNGLNIG